MNIQAKVALDKEKHPERFCKTPRCLWRVVKLDHATQTFSPLENCPEGYCPRHQPKPAVVNGAEYILQPYLGHGPRCVVRREYVIDPDALKVRK